MSWRVGMPTLPPLSVAVDPAPLIIGEVEAAPANAIIVGPDELRAGAVVSKR
jgi:hypothetical protein